jgi:adenylate cyclase class 2
VREIEVKYRIQDAEALTTVLRSAGIALGEPIRQDDQAYAPQDWEFGDAKLGVSFARLRTVQGRHFFALKQPTINAQSCLEYETEVSDREAMHQAILQMGFRATVRVTKMRRTASVDGMSLCLDQLRGVGVFLELERMVADHVRADLVQAELAAFVDGLGIEALRTAETYDSLVRGAQVTDDSAMDRDAVPVRSSPQSQGDSVDLPVGCTR